MPPVYYLFTMGINHSYIASENLLIRFSKGNLPCLHFDLKALPMTSFWPEGIGNAFLLSKNHCKCLSFWPEGIANAFLFTLNGKFSLTIGMIMPLGWGEVTGIIPKLVTQGSFWFPFRDFRDSFGNYFLISLVASHSWKEKARAFASA